MANGGNGAQTVTLAEVGAIAASASKRAELFWAVYFGGSQATSGELSNDASGMTSFAFGAAPSNNHYIELFLREAPGPATGTYGLNGSVHTGWRVLACGVIDGVDTSSTLTAAVKATNTGTGTGNPSCPSVTGAAVGDIHIIGVACNTGGGFGTQTPPAGYTLLWALPEGNAYYRVVQAGDLTGSTLAAQTVTTTGTPSSWVSMSCVLKASTVSAANYRYYRFQCTEAAVSNTMTASDINLLDGAGSVMSRAGWSGSNVTASSSVSGNNVSNTYDGSGASTFWETNWQATAGTVGANAPPYYWQIDLGSATQVSALRYTPRGGSMGNNGAVGYFDIYGSNDGSSWTVLTGGWQPAFSAIDGNATIEIQVSAVAAAATASPSSLKVQQRAPGFPTGAPLPGIPMLGRGVLQVPKSPIYTIDQGGAAASAFAVTAAGLITFTGSGSATVSSFAASAAGLETFTGTGSAAESPFAASGAGTEAFSGSGSAAASPFAATGSGTETFTGSGSAACSSFAADGVANTGAAAPPTPTFWAQPQPLTRGYPARSPAPLPPSLGQGILAGGTPPATGGAVSGSGSAACSPFAASGTGTITFTGSGSAACQPFAVTGTGLEAFTATATAAMSSFAASAAGAEAFAGSGSAAASPFAGTGAGTESFTGSGSAAAQPFAAVGNAAVGTVFTGSGSAALSPFAATSTGTESFTGTGSAAASPFAITGIGSESFAGSGSVAVSPFAIVAVGFVGDFIGSGTVALSPFAAAGVGAGGTAFKAPPTSGPALMRVAVYASLRSARGAKY